MQLLLWWDSDPLLGTPGPSPSEYISGPGLATSNCMIRKLVVSAAFSVHEQPPKGNDLRECLIGRIVLDVYARPTDNVCLRT